MYVFKAKLSLKFETLDRWMLFSATFSIITGIYMQESKLLRFPTGHFPQPNRFPQLEVYIYIYIFYRSSKFQQMEAKSIAEKQIRIKTRYVVLDHWLQ